MMAVGHLNTIYLLSSNIFSTECSYYLSTYVVNMGITNFKNVVYLVVKRVRFANHKNTNNISIIKKIRFVAL